MNSSETIAAVGAFLRGCGWRATNAVWRDPQGFRVSGVGRALQHQLDFHEDATTTIGAINTSRQHRQVPVRVGDRAAEVDAGLAVLIEALWSANISTVMSCESLSGRVWLVFPDAASVEELIVILSDPTGDGWSRGLLERAAPSTAARDDRDWRLWHNEQAWNYAASLWLDSSDGKRDLTLQIMVYLPPSDIEPVVRQLRHAARTRSGKLPPVCAM